MSSARLGGHPIDEVVARFLRGEASPAEARHVVRHLLAGCGECRQAVGGDWRRVPELPTATAGEDDRRLPPNVLPFPRREDAAIDYRPVFERAFQSVDFRQRELTAEQLATPPLVARLEAMAPADRLAAMRNDTSFHHWALIGALLDESRSEGFSRPLRALELAELALAGATRLDGDVYPPAAVADLTARAWALRGNALRILGRFAEAGESLDRAGSLLARGSGDPAERSRVLMMTASLCSRQGRLDEAETLLDRAHRLAVRCGDRHLQGSARVRQSRLAQRAGETDRALELLAGALGLIDPEVDSRLLLTARHNHVLLMIESGRYREALDRIEETRDLHVRVGSRLDFLRFRWLEGRLYAGLGWLRQAAGHFEDVRRAFIDAGLAYDVALVSLDLAALRAQEGRTAEVRELAEQMLPIFRSREAQREVIASLLVFRDAARREVATVRLIQRVADELRRERRGPELPLRSLDGSG